MIVQFVVFTEKLNGCLFTPNSTTKIICQYYLLLLNCLGLTDVLSANQNVSSTKTSNTSNKMKYY